jgi:hypothetical protein
VNRAFTAKQMELNNITLSEISQEQKDKYSAFFHLSLMWKAKKQLTSKKKRVK